MAPSIEQAVQTNDPPNPQSGVLSSTEPTNVWHPQTVLSTLPHQPQIDSASPLPFFHLLERLKTTKREGWRRFGIDRGESISDHMYRMSIITMLCPPALARRLDIARCTRMALVHDMAESLVGDITPVDGVSKTEKSRREAETMDYMCGSLLGQVHGGEAGQAMRDVWQEYEDDETEEAHFVHDVDKMELLLQMLEYERASGGKTDLGEFAWVSSRIKMPEVQAWAEELLEARTKFWADHGKELPTGGLKAVSSERRQQQDEYYGATTNGDAATSK